MQKKTTIFEWRSTTYLVYYCICASFLFLICMRLFVPVWGTQKIPIRASVLSEGEKTELVNWNFKKAWEAEVKILFVRFFVPYIDRLRQSVHHYEMPHYELSLFMKSMAKVRSWKLFRIPYSSVAYIIITLYVMCVVFSTLFLWRMTNRKWTNSVWYNVVCTYVLYVGT